MPFDSIQRRASIPTSQPIVRLAGGAPKKQRNSGLLAGLGILFLSVCGLAAPRVFAVIGQSQGTGAQGHAGHALRQPAAVTNGLVAWYPLDGSAKDASGNGNDGTPVGAPTAVSGKFGKSFSFNGSSQYVTVPDASSLRITAALSVSAWVNPAVSGTSQVCGASFAGKSASGDGWRLGFNCMSGIPAVEIKTAGGWLATTGSTAIPVGIWSLVSFTFDGSTVTLYVNGQSVATRTQAGPITYASNYPVILGGQTATGGQFNGSIDDIRIYNRAITSAEVGQLYSGSQPVNCDQSCVGWWKLDESSGTSTKDSTGNGNTGTLNNFTFDGTTNGWTSGVFGNGLQFNGSNTYVDVPNSSALNPSGPYTLEAWIKTTGNAGYAGIISKRIPNSTQSYGLQMGGSGNQIYCSNGVFAAITSGIYADGKYHLATCTFDGSYTRAYVDGVLAAAPIGAPAAVSTTADVMIGFDNCCTNIRYFNGTIDDARIYSRALTNYEIYDQYSAGRSN